MRDACRTALDDFPNRLEFAYDEAAQDSAHVAELRSTAELWSELGHVENYTTKPIPDRSDAVQIAVSSPRHEAPEVQAAVQRHAQASREMELWLWVDKCFASGSWAAGFSVDEAVMRAKELAEAVAEARSLSSMHGLGITECAIAGTAAVVICFADTADHEKWADPTIEAFRVAPEEMSNDTFTGSVIPWHPKIFVAHALSARIRTGHEHPGDHDALYDLITHPIEVVSFAALDGLASCWERDARFAWCGLNLGLRLAQLLSRRDMYRLDEDARRKLESDRLVVALTVALDEYRAQGPLPAWVLPRPSWVQVAKDAEDLHDLDNHADEGWQRTDDLWDSRYAAKVLQKVPVAAVMASGARSQYVDAIEALLAWTLDTSNPMWRTQRRRGRKRDDGTLYEWEYQLGRKLADVAPHLPYEESVGRFLQPIVGQPDEIATRLLEPFTVSLVCGEVLDAPEVRDGALRLLQAVLDRTLENDDLRRSPYNDGRMTGLHLPKLVKSLLFVVVEDASGAARFANGAWHDLDKVLPLVEHMVRAAGWHPYVARQFVTLCERSGAAFPTEQFADLVLSQITDGHLPAIWKGSSIPARIAALVQAHADYQYPLPIALARKLLGVLDALVDMGDRRSAALQQSESFRGVRMAELT